MGKRPEAGAQQGRATARSPIRGMEWSIDERKARLRGDCRGHKIITRTLACILSRVGAVEFEQRSNMI